MTPGAPDLAGYHDLIARKGVAFTARGLAGDAVLPPGLFPHQEHGIRFALRAGCAAMFYDTGLGKTRMALAWGDAIVRATNRPVLMLCPLAVAAQHKREADELGVEAHVIRDGTDLRGPATYILNYDRLGRVDAGLFAGVILDESSILKSFTGATTRGLTQAFARTPYRLACTATPAPNDHMELGTHAEFLGVMRQAEMLPLWFIHDSADTGTWRVKGHAREAFWRWVASWARCVSSPSDLGFSNDGFDLPALDVRHHEVRADLGQDAGQEKDGQGRLFRSPQINATSIHKEKRLSLDARADRLCEVVSAEPGEAWTLWVETNAEADALCARLPAGAFVEVRGDQSPEEKERRLVAFSTGAVRIIVTKPSIAGFGLNWQHCARVGFAGLSFSYEQYYQAVRRSWRFGQKRPVQVHIVGSDTERSIFEVVARKAGDHEDMKMAMAAAMSEAGVIRRSQVAYNPQQEAALPAWLAA